MPSYPSIELLLRQSRRGVGQINARSGAKQSALAPFAARAAGNYAPAVSGQQQLGGALSASLVSQGHELGGTIEQALTGIQAPSQAISTHAGGTVSTGAAAGAASGALSSADLERLRGHQSAEQIYASALPRLAQLAGEQERRGFLAQAQQELSDLSLREAAQAAETQRDEREWQYRMRQDKIEQQRYRRDFRSKQRDTAYDRRSDALDRREQARRDRLAQAAAAQEYGLDVVDYQLDERSQSERERAARVRESQAAQRERRQAAKDARDAAGDGGSDRADAFYEAREDAFKRAREYANPKSALADPLSRATARKRLMAEFGTALIGRGYKAKAVRQMIERALDASGY